MKTQQHRQWITSIQNCFENYKNLIQTFIGIGSNLGNRETNFAEALSKLTTTPLIDVHKKSRIYETEPLGYPNQPAFLNAALEIHTSLNPFELLQVALDVENDLGRSREVKWGPRTIDLDLLLYGRERFSAENLVIPHPRLKERKFVLMPLIDLNPQLYVPGVGETIQSLLDKCQDASKVTPYTPIQINW